MKQIIITLTFILVFGKTLAQVQWNIVPNLNDTTTSSFGYFINVIDSSKVVLIPNYTYESSNILKTTDAGQTWTSHIIAPAINTFLHEAEFMDANTGYIVGGTDFGAWNIFLKTTDGGITWQDMNAASSFSTNFPTRITELSFVTDQTGFIARKEENKIYRTTNGGTNFTALDLPQISNDLYSYITEIRFISPDVGFVVRMITDNDATGTIEFLKTTDGGTTWSVAGTTDWENISTWEKKDKIQFLNHLEGFAIVGTGILKITQDGGNSWTERNLPLTTPPPKDFHFVNNACGYVALGGNIYRTDDAGQSWSLQTIESNLNSINYIRFATENFGYALNYESEPQGQNQQTSLLNTDQQPAPPLSLASFEDHDSLTIYPNPADDVIHIQTGKNTAINFIHLMDISGKIIKTYKDNPAQLDVSAIHSGVYLLFIQTPQQKIVKKVIIK